MLSARISAVLSLIVMTLFSLSSCDDSSNLGLDLQPDQLQVSTAFEVVDLEVGTIWFDSIETYNTLRMLVGRTSSPDFGVTKATAFTEVILPIEDTVDLLPGTSLDVITLDSIMYDSVTLLFDYDVTDGNVDLQNTQKFFIHQLTENLDTTNGATYYNNSTLPKGFLLSELDFQPTDSTSFIRFKLEDILGRGIYEEALAGRLGSTENLQALIKGFVISTDDNGEAMYGLNLLSATSLFNIHYHYYEDGDTIQRTFPMIMGNHFHQIEFDRTGSTLASLPKNTLVSSTTMGNKAYMQAGTGLFTYVKMPESITDFSLANKRAINRAELIIRPIDGSVTDQTTPPAILEVVLADANQRLAETDLGILDVITDDANRRPINYNAGGQGYFPFIFSRHVEDVANERIENNGFFIAPETLNLVNNPLYNTTSNGLILGNSQYTSTDFSIPLQLKIYYTEFK